MKPFADTEDCITGIVIFFVGSSSIVDRMSICVFSGAGAALAIGRVGMTKVKLFSSMSSGEASSAGS